ncbi:hypothetical protein GUJ93_ZPchr0008g11584 [Zizania palustris]|uniref:Poly(A) RNA polymerase mitochondrial-like central palm domain-containing protein n=1 Tax=Zizania palustris TaxID=103762 RepID=A0A8J5UXF0_ZIZPA|nr:hypothetical protein GUJ93_ZPchr0008g11584 [Zizania palustris]
MAAAAAAVPPVPSETDTSSRPEHSSRPPSLAISWDSQALCKHAENCELESAAFLINPTFIPILEGLLLEIYAMLRPNPDDYKKRHIMLDVFNKIAEDIFGKKNGFPVVEAFGSFTMDLFTPKSDLDLSVNFNANFDNQFSRKDKISVIRKLAKVLQSHQRNGRCHGVLPVVTARVPVLKAIDKGTGVECDISVENKDGMSRSMIFKFISSIDERFQIICYLMKFWAKAQGVNCPKDRTMSSMVIISLVAFHLQTRCPPILPAFSVLLKEECLLFEGFGCRNKESVAELFVSLMSKLLSVERLWEQGLCASNFEGSWISKAWERGVGNLSVEDFLDRSQNFARSVGKVEMQKICECIRVTVLNLTEFFSGKIDAPKLKALVFTPVHQDDPVSNPNPKLAKGKRNSRHDPENSQKKQKKRKRTVHPGLDASRAATDLHPGSDARRAASDLHHRTTFVPHIPQVPPIQPFSQPAHTYRPLITPSRATASTRNCNICNAGDSSHCRKRDAFHHSLVLPDTMAITRQGKVSRSTFPRKRLMYGVHQKISFSSCKLQPALLLSLSNRQHGR